MLTSNERVNYLSTRYKILSPSMMNKRVTIPATVVKRSVLTPSKEAEVIRGVQVVDVAKAAGANKDVRTSCMQDATRNLRFFLISALSITFHHIQPPPVRRPPAIAGSLQPVGELGSGCGNDLFMRLKRPSLIFLITPEADIMKVASVFLAVVRANLNLNLCVMSF